MTTFGPMNIRTMLVFPLVAVAACGDAASERAESEGAGSEGTESEGALVMAATSHENEIIDLWAEGLPAFGVYVPNEGPRWDRDSGEPRPAPVYTAEGGELLGQNPLYDFVFLNLEGAYDGDAVAVIGEGLRRPSASSRKSFLVRIPPISMDGEDVARERVNEILSLGADGIILPHIRSVEEAKLAISFFEDAGADVWSPSNPTGEVIVMLMVEDPDAVAAAGEIADLPGFSMLSCGVGSLTGALGGDREGAEAGALSVLAEATRAGLASMMTANADNIERRVSEGFQGLLMFGETADGVITTGRALAGR